ncbi:hypothetical protein Tco_1098648, partial [Tanacetum coccineum]
MSGSQDEIPPPPPPPPSSSQTPTQQTPHTVSTIKLPILKKGEYDIWAMKMEHYLAHTDYPIWEVIQNGNGPVSITTDTQGQIKVLPPRTAEEIVARERERKARTTLLMALPEDHLAKFHKMTDAKEMWDAIKSRFGGNDESKKMQKYILKQQFEGFSVSNSEGLHKGYDRFQSLLSQLEIHRAGVSTEDANQKFLRSLPSAWSQVSLIIRTKPGVDSLSFDDLYNNLRVFENDVKGSIASSSSPQNVAFVSENTSSTNEVSTAYSAPNPSGQNSQYSGILSYENEVSQSVFKGRESDFENPPLYKRLVKTCEMQAVPPPMTGNYMPSGPDIEIDDSQYKYGPEKTQPNSDDEYVSVQNKGLDTPGFANKQVKTPRENVKNKSTHSQKPKVNNKELGHGFTERASVPPPMTGNYLPSGPDIEIDDSQYTYGPRKSQPSESESQTTELDTCDTNTSTKSSELVSEPVVNESYIEVQPKVWFDAPIIEEYESDSDDEHVSVQTKGLDT